MKKQKGYTLVEMLIVIAIMVILAGVSIASIGVINKAKYNSAISSFKNNVSALWVITKATSQAKVQPSVSTAGAFDLKYPICMRLQKNLDDTYWLVLGYHAKDGFIPKQKMDVLDDQNIGKKDYEIIEFPKILNIEYTAEDSSQEVSTMTNSAEDPSSITTMDTPVSIIEFNKSDGSVKYGAGTYTIKYYDRVVGTVKLDAATGKIGNK